MLPALTRVPSNAAHSAQPKSSASATTAWRRFDRQERPLNPFAAAISLRTSLPPPTYVMLLYMGYETQISGRRTWNRRAFHG